MNIQLLKESLENLNSNDISIYAKVVSQLINENAETNEIKDNWDKLPEEEKKKFIDEDKKQSSKLKEHFSKYWIAYFIGIGIPLLFVATYKYISSSNKRIDSYHNFFDKWIDPVIYAIPRTMNKILAKFGI